jgi:hypothetical protein
MLRPPTIIVGANYDSHADAPGGNDNATGTAAVIELARLLKQLAARAYTRAVRPLANEQPPYFRTPDTGSWRCAERLSDAGGGMLGMSALETIGAPAVSKGLGITGNAETTP